MSVDWYHPGEVVIVARVRRGQLDTERLHRQLREGLRDEVPADPGTLRSFVFDAPDEPESLVFLVQTLTTTDAPVTVRNIVESVHGRLGALGTDDIELVSAMPHWHLRAHEAGFGGSPGSDPVPVTPTSLGGKPGFRDYVPRLAALRPQTAPNASPIRVAVLDTHWDFESTRRRAEDFRDTMNNRQLIETIDLLRDSMQGGGDYGSEWQAVRQYHASPAASAAARAAGGPAEYHMPDHGLFVAGLVHGTAPHARLSYEPVLDDMGVGDLSLLLLGLQRVLANKPERAPQIINLSLGLMPHPARLPAAWYGLQRPHDPMYVHSPELADPDRDARWVAAHREHVDRTVDLLQLGLRELTRYLALNNCLVVAAAGNDSLRRTETGHVRMQPRLPARFETVLGVAATTGKPSEAAPYSNLGDERDLGDHVATFGGSITDHDQPEDGVIGIYAGEFPSKQPNSTGWAYWSGTSFATAIVSGIAANLWTQRPDARAAEILAQLHAEASASGPYVPELSTPAIEVEGGWRG